MFDAVTHSITRRSTESKHYFLFIFFNENNFFLEQKFVFICINFISAKPNLNVKYSLREIEKKGNKKKYSKFDNEKHFVIIVYCYCAIII